MAHSVLFDGVIYTVLVSPASTLAPIARDTDRARIVAMCGEQEVVSAEHALSFHLEHNRAIIPADHPALGGPFDPLARFGV